MRVNESSYPLRIVIILDVQWFHSCFISRQAVRFTSEARMFKQKCLQIRVFGYPSASQLDLDSFMLFSHSADMKVWLL